MPNKYKVSVSWTVEVELEVQGDSPRDVQENVYCMGINELRNRGKYNGYAENSMFVNKIEKVEGVRV